MDSRQQVTSTRKSCSRQANRHQAGSRKVSDSRQAGCRHAQSCWRNEGLMNRGMDRGRGLGIDEPFFVIHVRTSKSTRPFKFCTNSGSVSPSRFPKANSKRSIDFEDNTHPAQQPTPPQNKLDLCGSLSLWAHLVNIWWEVRGHHPGEGVSRRNGSRTRSRRGLSNFAQTRARTRRVVLCPRPIALTVCFFW